LQKNVPSYQAIAILGIMTELAKEWEITLRPGIAVASTEVSWILEQRTTTLYWMI
jgi:hypothetical protein